MQLWIYAQMLVWIIVSKSVLWFVYFWFRLDPCTAMNLKSVDECAWQYWFILRYWILPDNQWLTIILPMTGRARDQSVGREENRSTCRHNMCFCVISQYISVWRHNSTIDWSISNSNGVTKDRFSSLSLCCWSSKVLAVNNCYKVCHEWRFSVTP